MRSVIIDIWQKTIERKQKRLLPREEGYFCHVTTQFLWTCINAEFLLSVCYFKCFYRMALPIMTRGRFNPNSCTWVGHRRPWSAPAPNRDRPKSALAPNRGLPSTWLSRSGSILLGVDPDQGPLPILVGVVSAIVRDNQLSESYFWKSAPTTSIKPFSYAWLIHSCLSSFFQFVSRCFAFFGHGAL